MSGSRIELPGHPLLTCENIRRIDKRKWDRKGVAYLHYEAGSPLAPMVAKLDDFAYERQATDAILDRIEQNIVPTPQASAGRVIKRSTSHNKKKPTKRPTCPTGGPFAWLQMLQL